MTDPRERAVIEGARVFNQTIDAATGKDQATRRAELDRAIDARRCPRCGAQL